MAAVTSFPIMLYYAQDMEGIALPLAAAGTASGHTIVAQSIDWSKFRDGWPKLHVDKPKAVKQCDTVFLSSITHPAEAFEQFAVMYALPR